MTTTAEIGVEMHDMKANSHEHSKTSEFHSHGDVLCGCGVPQVFTNTRARYSALAIFILACLITGISQKGGTGILLFTLVFLAFVLFGDVFYSRFLANYVFELNEDEPCPANMPENEGHIDYVPTECDLLWGHHFTSIAGAAPIVGPAIAAKYGWLPATLWIGFGVILAGAVHDFSALVLSARNQAKTIGALAGQFLGPRAEVMFMIMLFFLCWIVIATFENVIADLFMKYPATVLPVWFEIITAVMLGCLVRWKMSTPFWPSILSITALYLVLYATSETVNNNEDAFKFRFDCNDSVVEGATCNFGNRQMWTIFLSSYALIASLLPIWLLIQPRDYLNAHQLEFCMIAVIIGLLILNPEVHAPAIRDRDELGENDKDIVPFLFVTIACGAVSGFHGLVSSGVTSKQLQVMTDARPIGYSAMLGEGTLAILTVVLVVSAAGPDGYTKGWPSGFNDGGASCLMELGLGETFSRSAISLLVVSFAATTLDSAVRIQRVLIEEFGNFVTDRVPCCSFVGTVLGNKIVSALIAIVPAVWLANTKTIGELWKLFGATNQLIATLTLILTTIYLYSWRQDWCFLLTAVPALGMCCFIPWALIKELDIWFDTCAEFDKWCDGEGHVVFRNLIGIVVGICFFWMILEVIIWCVAEVRGQHQRARKNTNSKAGGADDDTAI